MIKIIGPETFLIGNSDGQLRQITIDEIVHGWWRHASDDPFTKFLEDYSRKYIADGLPDETALLFVRMVCAWGGLRGNNFQILRESLAAPENAERSLGSTLRKGKCLSEWGCFVEAISTFDGRKGLGISFRSKILRFLCPDHAAILDSKIRGHLGYSNSAEGYQAFVADCISIRDCLNSTNHHHPLGRPWQTTDVEMGIFLSMRANN